ncbi:sensor histidine kinase [Azospirillum sp. ST 5-10]|uniref:sensor histidine kinase n=1 Tax=unclassified Azospirillum TaxID=2630922 RepID=UPI003F49D74A
MTATPEPPAVLAAVLDGLDAGVVVLDPEGRIIVWNAWMERAAGHAAPAAVGRGLASVFPGLPGSRVQTAIGEALSTGAPAVLSHTLNRFLFDLRRPDGETMVHNITVHRLDVADGPLCLLQIVDVTLQAERDRFLRERREARYRAVVDTALDAIVTTDVSGTIQWLNRAAERQFGYTAAEASGLDVAVLFGEGAGAWLAAADHADSTPFEVVGRRKDGTAVDLELSVARWTADGTGFVTGILRDVTERKRVQADLRRAVDQKSLLLREVNHRVKNSLHLVSSLLSLQMRGLSDDRLRHHFRDAIGRIHAVAQVHARLYQTERFQSVELATYLQAMIDDLVSASGGAAACDVRIDADAVELPIDVAIPLSLVANELITNAIKHGAAERVAVQVGLRCADGLLTFTVADSGPGLPAGFDPGRTGNLGMRIVSTLTRQIGGTVRVDTAGPGATFRIVMPLPEGTRVGRADAVAADG